MPSTSLNVIALISGGKDSLFSLLHCIQNGHKIIALANLYPVSGQSHNEGNTSSVLEGEDLNSFMYQTVGHTIVPLYAEALKLPLYRRQISGKAVNTGLEYAFTELDAPDETEDLVPLLLEIKTLHPEVNAMSTGAILSTYQRTRVESVAARLGLTSLAYLWQYPTLPPPVERGDSITGLLDDMEAAGCDARLIKIASAGITGSLLWSRVSDFLIRTRLVGGMSQYVGEHDGFALRGAVLGEGGEYETLAINGPAPVWKKRIDIDEKCNISLHDEGGAIRLSFSRAILADKAQEAVDDQTPLVRVPTLLDHRFKEVEKGVSKDKGFKVVAFQPCKLHRWICPKLQQNMSRSSITMTINNLVDNGRSADITEQTTAIIATLDDLLRSSSDRTNSSPRVIFTIILLRNMSDFAAVNTTYSKRFNHINPPARVTIGCGDSLPKDVLVSMSFTMTKIDPASISGLHVQSISYWAPANIGPYSQAISYPLSSHKEEGFRQRIVHVAGQIPLLPASMHISDDGFMHQAILSLQHLWRVGQSVGVDWWTHGIAYLADAESEQEIQERAKVAYEVWREANTLPMAGDADDEESDHEVNFIDAWDLKHNHQLYSAQPSRSAPANSHLHTLTNFNVFNQNTSPNVDSAPIPPFLAAHLTSLPRSAPIEWHSLGLSHLPKLPTSRPRLTVSIPHKTDTNPRISTSSYTLDLASPVEDGKEDQRVKAIQFFSIQIFSEPTPSPLASASNSSSSDLGDLPSLLKTALSISLSSRPEHPPSQDSISAATTYISSRAGYDAMHALDIEIGTVIPCHSLWGEGGRRVEIAIVGTREEIAEEVHEV